MLQALERCFAARPDGGAVAEQGVESVDRGGQGALDVVESVDQDRFPRGKPTGCELRRVRERASIAWKWRDQILYAGVIRLAVVAAESSHLGFDRPIDWLAEPEIALLAWRFGIRQEL